MMCDNLGHMVSQNSLQHLYVKYTSGITPFKSQWCAVKMLQVHDGVFGALPFFQGVGPFSGALVSNCIGFVVLA